MQNKFGFSLLLAIYVMAIGTSTTANALNATDISQRPVFIAAERWPGNLVLVPSMEWPTFQSVANLEGTYTPTAEFVGYFDSDKCYVYEFDATPANRHFRPVAVTADRQCFGEGQWSGNFLNWAATQTIDPFRKALTGGTRVRDVVGETWLEKARHPGQADAAIFPDRNLSGADLIEGATPFSGLSTLNTRVRGFETRMHFRLNDAISQTGHTPFDPGNPDHPNPVDPSSRHYSVEIRVAVCVPGLLEDNCVRYGSGNYKPEGLIQANSRSLRFSIFGYLNQDGQERDGAVLRARKKFVGPIAPGVGPNPNREWNPDTGILIRNPDPGDASDTTAAIGVTIDRSGVINYLNLAGQLNTFNHKSQDPVSEMFYAAVRYMRGLPNVPEYTDMSMQTNVGTRRRWADEFPVISDWQKDGHDPLLSVCQTNVALGIGDIYTHRDKNLPGNTSFRNDEPPMPPLVAADTWINVVNATNRVGQLQGIGTIGSRNAFTGRNNSAYIAGLAFWANTMDMRPDNGIDDVKVTMSTHWVDVLEARSLEGMARNQFALAAKFGGARVPDNFNPMTDTLQQDWWHTNGETLTPFGPRGNNQPAFLRPDNFYLAGNAAQMVESLNKAFENILIEVGDVVAAVSTTSSRINSDTLILLAGFDTEFWNGDIRALNPEDQSLEWRASAAFQTGPRTNIFTADPSDTSSPGRQFNVGLAGLPRTVIDAAAAAAGKDSNDLIRFVAGDRSRESDPAWRFRGDHTLGTIVNSNLVLSRGSNEGWARINVPANAGQQYIEYIDGPKATRGDWVFVGANDGMLHAFNATTGALAFSYAPFSVLSALPELADPDFAHRFFVDGGLSVSDAYIEGSWRTVLVGSLGAGGRGVFALDVTNPATFSSANVLWEYNSATAEDPDLGFTFGRPSITRLQNGNWAAVFGNGYGSDRGHAYLYVVNLANGQLIRKVELDTSGSNGLSSPRVWLDTGSRLFASRAYAGDLRGNMWRVDFTNSVPARSTAFTNGRLFREMDGRPITSQPTLAASPLGGLGVFFGTGRLVADADRAARNVDRFYSIVDRNAAIPANYTTGSGRLERLTLEAGPNGRRRITGNFDGANGWFIDLRTAGTDGEKGERVLDRASVQFGQLVFSTFEPSGGVCDASGGTQRIYQLNAVTGEGSFGPNGDAGVIVGVGAPIEITPVIGVRPAPDPSTPPDPFEPPEPGVDPPVPGDDFRGARDEWCSPVGYIDPGTGTFIQFGTICDGRQVWREAR